MYRKGSYDQLLAQKLSDRDFAREFLLGLIEGKEGFSLIKALKHTIWRMGVKEFSQRSKIPEKSISRMLGQKEIPKIKTLNSYLAPFGLKVKIDLEKVA